MQQFIGCKKVLGLPMTRAEYNDYRGWDLPEDEDGSDDGMLVEYVDGGASNHPEHNGYISWSPIDVFNKAYRSCDALTFGEAIECAKRGDKIARGSWNGKNMFVVYMSPMYLEADKVNERTSKFIGEGVDLDCQPYFAMFNAQQQWIPGWLASQSDMLCDDWYIVE